MKFPFSTYFCRMKKHEAIGEMNKRGAARLPFIFIIDYAMNDCKVLSPEEALSKNILFNFNGAKNYPTEVIECKVKILEKSPVDFSQYEQAFRYIQQQIVLGNSYLVNLTFPTPIVATGSLAEVFHSSRAKYRLLFNDRFVVFSPETFVKIDGETISTYPMKGTIDASLAGARKIISENQKEMAEHATVVDLLRNDLSRVAQNVRVEKYRYVDEIESSEKCLLQVSSEIKGDLPPNYRSTLGDIIFEMLPAGSVTGAPKKKTLEIIAEAENYDRGFYTGIAGYFDGENLDSCVLIRFIANIDGQLVYKSGGGITSQSQPQEEYQELIDKIYVPLS
jgi:para-aminobenzoate synthetase component 1